MGHPRGRLFAETFLLLLAFSIAITGCTTSTYKASMPDSTKEMSPKEYVIGPEDVLEISVWQNEDVSRVVNVRPDGKISLPLLHDIQAAGLTAEELKEVIARGLKPYMDVPEVTVIVQEINSWRIYVQGEVRTPGVYGIRSRTTLSQVISMAGGFTEFAKESKVQVLRERGGEREIIPVDYSLILKGDPKAEDIYLEPGDTIIVP
jgi:polysaccharide export outer membrane protein